MPKFIVEISAEDLETAKDASEMSEWTDAEYIQRTLEVIPLRSSLIELESVKVKETLEVNAIFVNGEDAEVSLLNINHETSDEKIIQTYKVDIHHPYTYAEGAIECMAVTPIEEAK